MVFEGYHGTKSDAAINILKSGYILSNNTMWFGKGVYFFEDYHTLCNGLEEAKNWAIYVKYFENWAVLKTNINTEKYIDIFLNQKHKELFDKIKKEMLNKHLSSGKVVGIFNEKVIFRKLEEKDIDLIRALVDASQHNGYPRFVVRRPQVQICVKNTDIIENTILIQQGKRLSV